MLLIDQDKDIRLTPPIGLGSVRLIDQRKRTRNVPTREHQTMKSHECVYLSVPVIVVGTLPVEVEVGGVYGIKATCFSSACPR